MSRFSFSPSTSPTQPPAVRDNQSVRDLEGVRVMVKVTSSPSATSKGSSGSNRPPLTRARIVSLMEFLLCPLQNEGRSKNYPKRTTSIMAVQMKPCRLFLVQENVQFHRADPTLGNRGLSVSGFPRVDRADATTSIIRGSMGSDGPQ